MVGNLIAEWPFPLLTIFFFFCSSKSTKKHNYCTKIQAKKLLWDVTWNPSPWNTFLKYFILTLVYVRVCVSVSACVWDHVTPLVSAVGPLPSLNSLWAPELSPLSCSDAAAVSRLSEASLGNLFRVFRLENHRNTGRWYSLSCFSWFLIISWCHGSTKTAEI